MVIVLCVFNDFVVVVCTLNNQFIQLIWKEQKCYINLAHNICISVFNIVSGAKSQPIGRKIIEYKKITINSELALRTGCK